MNENDKAVAVRQEQGGQLMEYSSQQVVRQVALIQEIMQKCMKENEHFGKIPGCGDKPTLLKAGAEKLNFTFRMAPDYEIDSLDEPNGHREYRIKCKMTHIATGAFLGAGVGSATTMETKWRYRNENTGKPVPTEYWDSRNSTLLGGDGFTPRKIEVGGKKAWVIFHQVEHPNPADYFNTCLKMAKKRALVDAVLTCTAASDIFTQDLEELKDNGVLEADEVPRQESRPPIREPQSQTPPPAKPQPAAAAAAPTRRTEPAEPAGGGNEIELTFDRISEGTTKAGKKRWYSLAGGVYYNTFSESVARAVRDNLNVPLIVEWKPGFNEKNRFIEGIRLSAPQADPPSEEPPDMSQNAPEDLPF